MKKLIVVLIPILIILILSPTVINAILTKTVKEKLPDYIPIEETEVKIHSNILTISGKLYGKIPLKLDFTYKFSFSEVTLTPQKAFLGNHSVPLNIFLKETIILNIN